MKFTDKKLYLLDMDGTLYLGDNLFEGTLEFLEQIKKSCGRYMFLTNNSSKSAQRYVEKLARLGIAATTDDFFTSTEATIIYLADKGYKKIYAMGTESFKKQLKEANFPITDTYENDVDCVVISNDQELTFKKLDDVCKILTEKDIPYIATNPDFVCPTEYGYVPDCGCFADIIYAATKKRPVFIGKPEPEMIYRACEKSGIKKQDAVIFGDRLYTDIRSGVNAGITTVFVLSGEGTMEDVKNSDFKPDFIFKDIKEFLNNAL